jgi:predicted esterase
MKLATIGLLSLFALATAQRPGPLSAQADDVSDVPSQDLRAGKDEKKRFFLIGPREGARSSRQGFGLVVILPGGPGNADFHPFVKRIFKYAIPDGYLVAQPVAVKRTDEQGVVWPTEKDAVAKMKFSTEKFVTEVITEVKDKHKVDPKKVFTLSWSSSGPAAYAISLTDNKTVAGSFIAMSVFHPKKLPSLERARGHAYYLYHSPDDMLCPFRMAQQAAKDLKKNGATVKLHTYKGGHGWRAGLYDHIREGIIWLEKNSTAAAGKK